MVRGRGMALVESHVDPQGEDHRNSFGSRWDCSALVGAASLAHDKDERLHELQRTWSTYRHALHRYVADHPILQHPASGGVGDRSRDRRCESGESTAISPSLEHVKKTCSIDRG